MPSPVGHIIAGLATGWVTQAAPASAALPAAVRRALPAAACLLAIAPDFDLLLAAHRTWTHSVTAAAGAGLVVWGIARWRGWPAVPLALAATAAVGSHIFLDWLGKDSSVPVGIMAFWPFSASYVASGLDLFWDVSRRYWLYDEFVVHNAKAAARELALIGPFAAVAWHVRRRSRLKPAPTAATPHDAGAG